MKTGTASLMPSTTEITTGLKDFGMVTAGVLAAHALVKATKDNTMVNGGVALVGLGVAIKVKNPLIKMLGVGAAVYGTIKLVSKVAASATEPGTTSGLSGILPEKAKELIRKFLPTISGIDEVAGIDDELSGDADIDALSLNDLSMRMPYPSQAFESIDKPSEMAGLGEVMDMVG